MRGFSRSQSWARLRDRNASHSNTAETNSSRPAMNALPEIVESAIVTPSEPGDQSAGTHRFLAHLRSPATASPMVTDSGGEPRNACTIISVVRSHGPA